jgi:hypothetical protein
MSNEAMRKTDHRVIYERMKDHFLGLLTAAPQPVPLNSRAAVVETVRARQLLIAEGYAAPHVDVLSRAALNDAVLINEVRNMDPEDFYGRTS